jgi:2-polyprenyl-6-methoxyphenol hydroxylase-like FAD-dependent oxidoreductase
LIVGAGPAGLVAGITLARYGIDVVVVDKRDGVSTLSRNLVISTRGMELMRRFGLEEAVRAGAADVEPRAWVTSTLASADGVEMPLGYPSGPEASRVSPTRPAWAPQDHHEPILLAHLRQAPTATLHFRCELAGLHPDRQDIRAVVCDRDLGTTREIHAQYLIAADGAHSSVRDQLGIGMDGCDHLADYERVEFTAALAATIGDRRYALYVVTRPDAAGVLAPRGRGDRWGLSRERTPGQARFVDLSEGELIHLIGAAAGVADLRVGLERLSTFPFAAQIAERYRQGNCFLVGDAAHRMTPRGGTGMNTAIQDSFDLGWKLAWVLRGWANPEMLDSYEAERRPIGLHNVRRTGQPTGARADTDDALPWDLNGRVAHHWVPTPAGQVSTIDLLGDGLTLLAAPGEAHRTQCHVAEAGSVPLTVHVLDATTAAALDLSPSGALLVRPDGREVRRW